MRPEDVVSLGDEITVMVIEVDMQGRVNLSRRAALSGEMPSQAELEHERHANRGPSRGGPPGRGPGSYGPPNRGGGYGDRNYGGGGGFGGRGGGYDRDGGIRDRGGYNNDRGGFGQRRPIGPGGPGPGRNPGGP